MADPADVLLDLYRVALAAVEPGVATSRALARAVPAPGSRTWVLGLGKAAHAMTRAAIVHLSDTERTPAGGLVAAADPGPPPAENIEVVVGDHPLPGPGSAAAAEALEAIVRNVRPGDDVWVLLSGGTSSLVAAPVRGIPSADLRAAYEVLFRSGLAIHEMNHIRKRISRWGAGRLAAALSHAEIHVFAVSDVTGNPASIGSGPCAPDPTTADRIRGMIAAETLDGLPPSVLNLLERTSRGLAPETPKPGDAVFRRVVTEVVASNRIAVVAAADEATHRGLRVRVRRKPVAGEAADCGTAIARKLASLAAFEAAGGEGTGLASGTPACFMAGGETTVTLGPEPGRGGRCQELALAAARELGGVPSTRVTLLAAGTDGRDGPTDYAGAIVDNDTWDRIRAAGRDPAADLEAHNSLPALEVADALVRTGPTGTNVADLVFALAT